MIFGFMYYIHYTFGGAPTQVQELEVALQNLPKVTMASWSESDLEAKMSAGGSLENGRAVFAGKCAACHGPDGGGLIGPNLTDQFWLHGKGTRADIVKVISEGVLEKGMPSWSTMISEADILSVAGFVYSIRGTKPANPKAPQGQEVP
jgi:cytochrome c oxidase cbb3-type subunit 3